MDTVAAAMHRDVAPMTYRVDIVEYEPGYLVVSNNNIA